MGRQLRVALTGERKTLLKERRRIDDRLSAIDVLLADENEPSSARPARKRGRPRMTGNVGMPPGAGKTAVVGLRSLLRNTLEPGRFMKPADVIQLVERKGWAATGKTPINFRIYNELKRMRKEGELDRDDKGRYALKG